jgi:Na+-transporting methylmalonyl-CoA/oxaloacetate decarboxylase gamma subunit
MTVWMFVMMLLMSLGFHLFLGLDFSLLFLFLLVQIVLYFSGDSHTDQHAAQPDHMDRHSEDR